MSLAVVVPKLSVAGRDLLQVGQSFFLLFDGLNLICYSFFEKVQSIDPRPVGSSVW